MLRRKGGVISKPSKASLKSRGLSSNRFVGQGSKTSSLEGCYSLYSTDSEDYNVAGVSKGLDKCAELLTNILEINHEKTDIQKHSHSASKQSSQSVLQKNKKQKNASSSRPDPNKAKGSQMLKRKSRNSIHIPTVPTRSNQQLPKSKPAYNERVVASTPVLTIDQRKRQQELRHRETVLQKQIQQLQNQYENLQNHDGGQCAQDSTSQNEKETEPQLSSTKHKLGGEERTFPGEINKHEARRSLDFTSNAAEKPFIDNFKEEKPNGLATESTFVMQNEANLKERTKRETRKVQFVKQNQCESQDTDPNTSQTSQSDLSKAECHDSTSNKSNGQSPTLVSEAVKEDATNAKERSSTQNVLSPYRNTDHLRILTYLVGELKAVLGASGDVEVERLLMEIENEIRLLSYTREPSETSPVCIKANKQHDIDTEIALQPLTSENSVLRRKLRIVNQKVKELENFGRQVPVKERNHSPPNEGLIESLHHQLQKARDNVGKLTYEKEQAEKKFIEYDKDNSNLQHRLSHKEKQLQTLDEELKRQKSKAMTVDQAKLQLESLQVSLHAKNKEVGLLNLALQQRDAEIERLTELTRGLQQSLTRVLTNVQELHPDDIASDISTLSLLDSWKPREQRTTRLSLGLEAHTSDVNQLQVWNDNFYDNNEMLTDKYKREYHKENEVSASTQNDLYSGDSSYQGSVDDTSLSVSSADEFIFKQELANLDSVLARLQDSLRDKS